MKPRLLKIKGLNSFVEEQIIDFSSLTEKGLFGIFGPTGSGKSTILDAITIALYGTIARDTREFMNTYCDSLMVSYEFEIAADGERRIYCAERVFSRDKSGSYKSKHVTLIQRQEGGTVVIAEGVTDVKTNIEKILGLTSEDFTRSVVLPQGKFNEFLKLTGKDRRNMLERLFSLEKFGRRLGDRIRAKKREYNDSLNVVIGRVKTYEEKGISEENYNSLKENLKLLEKKKKDTQEEKQKLDSEYEINKSIWEFQLELGEYEKKERELDEELPIIESKRDILKGSRSAWKVKPYIDDLNNTELKIKKGEEEISRIKEQLKVSSDSLYEKERDYKLWQEKREKELPELIQKETNLKRALEMLEKLKALEDEREELLKHYSEKNKTFVEMGKQLENITETINKDQSERQLAEEKLESLRIDPLYRDDINKLAALQDEYNKLGKSLGDIKLRQKSREKLIKEVQGSLKKILDLKDERFIEIAVTEERLIEVKAAPPPENQVLFEKREGIFKLEKLTEELEGFEKKRAAFILELSAIEEKKAVLIKNQTALTKSNVAAIEGISLLEKEIKDTERKHLSHLLAEELKEGAPCPVCGSSHHPDPAITEIGTDLTKLTEEMKSLIIEQKRFEEDLRILEVEGGSLDKNKEYIVNILKPLEEQYKHLKLEELLQKKIEAEKEFELMHAQIQTWNKNKEVLEKQLGSIKDQKAIIEQDEIKLSEKLKAEKAALQETAIDIDSYEKRMTPIYGDIEVLKDRYNIENIAEEQKKLRDREREGRELELKVKELNEHINKLTAEKETFTSSKAAMEIDIAKILESGKEKRNVIDRERQYISELAEGREANKYREEVITRKAELISGEEKAKKLFENCCEENRKLSEGLIKETTTSNSLMLQCLDQRERLKEQLKVNSFESDTEISSKLLPEENMLLLEQEINSFEKNKNNVTANLQRILSKIGERRLDEEEWQCFIARRTEVNNFFEESIKEIAAAMHRLKEMEIDLTDFKALLKNRKELEHVCSNIDDIAKLIEGNKFVEFVALNQLKYICIEASKRLKNITAGRYALEIDNSGNFIMRDDFSGGARRATGTLSGGETFLTSLCLALSLSSQIQLKGSAPLEFFFLDEGFGTLDNDLLDTVMDSLEKLYSDRLCVGIISHVEEIKNRVPVKLLVEPARHGVRGSKIRLELS